MTIKEEIPFQDSTIETIDFSMWNWLSELAIHCQEKDGWKPVPMKWFTEERSSKVKKGLPRERRSGTVLLPLMVVERTGIEKNLNRKGTAWGNIPHEPDAKGGAGTIVIARRIQQEKTSNFEDALSKQKRGQLNFPRKASKTVYETISIPMPVYVDVTYNITIRTNFQQQMNEIIQPFMTKTGGINYVILKHEGHRYEAFIQEGFDQNFTISELGEEEQIYETTVTIKVLGHLIGDGKNQEQPKVVIRENAVDVKIPRERIVFDDELEHTDKQRVVGTEKIRK